VIDTGSLSKTRLRFPGHVWRRVPTLQAAPFVLLVGIVVCAAFGTWIAPADPEAQDLLNTLAPPSAAALLGTDELGRDVLSRAIVGARSAVVGPLLIAAGSMAIGLLLGLLAGYKGGWIDAAISRVVDLVWALPGLLVAIVIVGVLGGGYFVAVAFLTVLLCPEDVRLIRGATLAQRGLPYVEAARTLGLGDWRIMIRHILPNLVPLLVAKVFLTFALAIVVLSSLSFLGLGVPPGTPDWGRMLSESRVLIFDNPATGLVPGALILLTATSATLIGDWLFEQRRALQSGPR